MIKKIFILLIAFNLISQTCIIGYAVPETNENKSMFDDNANIINTIESLDNNIENKMLEINDLEKLIENKKYEIDTIKVEIENSEKIISQKEIELGESMRIIQKEGGLEFRNLMYIDAIFSADNLLQVIENINVVSNLVDKEKNAIEKSINEKEKLELKEKEIDDSLKEMDSYKKEREKEVKELEIEKQKQEYYITENLSKLTSSDSITVPIYISSSLQPTVKNILDESQKYLGIPYLWGGTTPNGFDCSGFVQYVFNKQNINLPRTSQEQQKAAKQISIKEIQPGDLVFNKEISATHVGLYLGNDLYIHSPHTGDVIKINKLSTSNMRYAGRILY